MKKGLIYLFLLALSFYGCNNPEPRKKTEKNTEFPTGKITESVSCKKNPMQSYTLYLPSAYNPSRKFPVVFIFDARARAMLAVKKFQKAAEKFGYILIASRTSKNGQPIETSLKIYDDLLADAMQRFSVDRRRIYTAGFSGGSRVAASIAITKGGVHSVFGISAGLPKMDKAIQNRFHYIGFAGTRDFNYYEMTAVEAAFERAGLNHHLIVFDGIHDWPPADTLESAMLWAECNAMRDLIIPKNDSLIKHYLQQEQNRFEQSLKTNDLYTAYQITRKIVHFFKDIADIAEYENKLKELSANKAIKNYENRLEALEKEVMQLQRIWAESFNKKIEWWKLQIAPVVAKQKALKDPQLAAAYDRLFSYIGVVAFSGANEYMNKKNFAIAQHFLEIYRLVEPRNPEYAYQYARFHLLKNGNANAAIEMLNKAEQLNFDDYEKLQSDSLFNKLKGEKQFNEVAEKIKNRSQQVKL